MNKRHAGRKLAILATVASLAVGAAALGPTSASASSCGSKTIAASAKGGKKVTFPVSRIQVSGGATCKVAYSVIRGYVLHQTPKGWRVTQGTFDVPQGLTGEVATKGKMMVRFALVGGRT
jgi:hypothetical protein